MVLSNPDEVMSHAHHRLDDGSSLYTVPAEQLDDHGLAGFPLVTNRLGAALAIAKRVDELHATEAIDVIQSPNYSWSGLLITTAVPHVVRLSSYAPWYASANGQPTTRELLIDSLIEHHVMARADLLIAPSQRLADLVQAELGHAVQVVRPPVSPAGEQVEAQRDAGIAFVGSLSKRKGCDVLAAAARELAASGTTCALHLCGPDAGCLSCFDGIPAPVTVTHHGTLEHARLMPLLRRSRCLVAPSRADNCPNTVLEANALGLRVIGTTGSSVDEIIDTPQRGRVVAAGDAHVLAAAIRAELAAEPAAAPHHPAFQPEVAIASWLDTVSHAEVSTERDTSTLLPRLLAEARLLAALDGDADALAERDLWRSRYAKLAGTWPVSLLLKLRSILTGKQAPRASEKS